MSKETPLEKEYIPQSQQMWNNYMGAVDQNKADYGNIMGGYQDFSKNLGGPTKFNYQNVQATNPAEQQEAYGYLREAMPGYRDFAQTGGYSPTDIQELRARGVAPIRAAYGNTMMEMNRARALGGSGGAPNYIAAASKAQRELPGQMADATTTVNAGLADAIRQGKLAGLSGMSGIGSTMGGLASQDAGRMLQASMSNQNADLQAQQLSEQSLQNLRQNQLASLSGQSSLYGTTPGMSSMFGNQALQAYQNRIALETLRNQTGLGLLGKQIDAYGGQSQEEPWWKTALGMAGSAMNMLGKPQQQQQQQQQSYRPQQQQFNMNTPVTPDNWYNNAPKMPTYISPQPQTSGRVVDYRDPNTGEVISGAPQSGDGTDTFWGDGLPEGWNSNPWDNYDWGPEYDSGGSESNYDPYGPGSGGQTYNGEWYNGVFYPYGSA
jgi:hypothetical protein